MDERPSDRNVEAIRDRLAERSARGIAKYGTTTERGDLSRVEWLRHLQEELLDGAVYIEAAIARTLDAAQPAGEAVVALDVFRIAGGDVECSPNPSAAAALECLRDLRECYDEAIASAPPPPAAADSGAARDAARLDISEGEKP